MVQIKNKLVTFWHKRVILNRLNPSRELNCLITLQFLVTQRNYYVFKLSDVSNYQDSGYIQMLSDDFPCVCQQTPHNVRHYNNSLLKKY